MKPITLKLISILMILSVIITIMISSAACQPSSDGRTTETIASTIAIPEQGMAMVQDGATQKLVSGEIITDANGHSVIIDVKTGETYDLVATQLIDSGNFATATVKDLTGQTISVTGPILSTTKDGTSVILDPTTGNQYIVSTAKITSVPAPTNTTTNASSQTAKPTSLKPTTQITGATTSKPTTNVTTTVETTENFELGEDDIVSTDPALETISPEQTTAATTTAAPNKAIPMGQTFIQDVLNEINRVRSDKDLAALKIDADSPEYAATVKAFASDLALQKTSSEASFPHVWIMVSTTSGTQAAKQLLAKSTAALNPDIRLVAIAAAQSTQTGDVYLVIAF
ncbi:MAG: hypothetical protein VB070_15075 [Clostridiaceae bacterium]|nr:hypothetical protein [Clostridiaceae bacterium]